MPKKTDGKVLIRIFQLRQLGLTLAQMQDHLYKEFDDGLVPDESTISRILKRLPPEAVREDVPFTWSTMTEVPWEQSRAVLDIWSYYESLIALSKEPSQSLPFGPFTRRLAKWSWRILQTLDIADSRREGQAFVPLRDVGEDDWYPFPFDGPPYRAIETPTGYDVICVALEYAWREVATTVLGEAFDTKDLDMWLAFTPWKGMVWLQRYQCIKYPQGVDQAISLESQDEPIRWHIPDLEWLDKVAPEVARTQRLRFPGLVQKRPPESAADPILRKIWNVAVSPLLFSQIAQYRGARLGDAGKGVSEPWYFAYLDEVGAIPDKAKALAVGKDKEGDIRQRPRGRRRPNNESAEGGSNR